MGEMEAVQYHWGRRKFWWRFFLVATIIAIVAGVGFGIFKLVDFTRNQRAEVIFEDNITSSVGAQEACERIADEYKSNREMYFSDAVQMFEDEKDGGDSLWRMYFAVCYAEFLAQYDINPTTAPDMLKSIDVSGLNKPARQYYYFSLADLYANINDDESASYYNAKGEELMDE